MQFASLSSEWTYLDSQIQQITYTIKEEHQAQQFFVAKLVISVLDHRAYHNFSHPLYHGQMHNHNNDEKEGAKGRREAVKYK